MSIEKALADLTAALEANTAALLATGGSDKPARASDAALEKVAEAAVKGKAAAEEKPKRAPAKKAPAKEKAMTEKELYDFGKSFLDVEDDEDYADRKRVVKDVCDHYGINKLTEVEAELRSELKGRLEAFVRGEDPFEDQTDAPAASAKRGRDDDDI